MPTKTLLICFLSLSCWNLSHAASPIYNLCPNTRKLNEVTRPQELAKAMCKLQGNYLGEKSVVALTNSILKTLGRLENAQLENLADWQKDDILNFDLERLSNRLSYLNQSDKASLASTPLQKALDNIKNKWSDEKVRTLPENNVQYIADLKHALSLTKTGKKVSECYEKAKGPLISREEVVELSEDFKQHGAQMAFSAEPDDKNPGKYIKRLYFNSQVEPFEALMMMGHELQHGCNSLNQIRLKSLLNDLPVSDSQNADEMKKEAAIFEEIEQDNAVDEMRAYRVTANVFKDLAEASPELVCGQKTKSIIFGKQVLSSAEYAANIEDKIEDGTFPQYIISKYAAHGFYTPKNVLTVDENGNPTSQLRPDLIKKMKAEGVRVAP